VSSYPHTNDSSRDGLGHFLRNWLRGQLLISLVIAILIWLGLSWRGLPAPLTLGILTGLAWMIPWLGGVLAYLTASIIVMIIQPGWSGLLQVTIIYSVVSLLESLLLTPWIMGRSVGVSPLMIMLALFLGGAFFGVPGLLLAVPGAVLVSWFWRNYRQN
jgi:predicted PurR-regulated permease PerM